MSSTTATALSKHVYWSLVGSDAYDEDVVGCSGRCWESVQLGRCWQSQWEADGASHHEANAWLACAQLVARRTFNLYYFIIFEILF